MSLLHTWFLRLPRLIFEPVVGNSGIVKEMMRGITVWSRTALDSGTNMLGLIILAFWNFRRPEGSF